MKEFFKKKWLTIVKIGSIVLTPMILIINSGAKTPVTTKTITLYDQEGNVLKNYHGNYSLNFVSNSRVKLLDDDTNKYVIIDFMDGSLVIEEE